jgi:complex iron-sulfur molybdoenzyme family reductase subunit gamma
MKRDKRALAFGLVVVLVLLTALVPMLVQARPAYEVPVTNVTNDTGSLTRPGGIAWSRAPGVEIPLTSADSGLPDADDTSADQVTMTVAHTDRDLYVRLSWPDATKDTADDSTRTFSDAAAVQLPVNASERPALAMGSTRNPVNVWYWNANTGTEELLAAGPGTTTKLDNPMVAVSESYSDGRWRVVFARSLRPNDPKRTTITMDRDVDVAVAVWNGSNMERSGRKATSEWYYLPLGPDTGGPPFEELLWAIAGIALVATILLTYFGVSRYRDSSGDDVL